MSVLIRGMEMPTEDEEIIIRISPNGTVMTEYALPITGVKAVLVPPHGRTIDADVLSQMFDPDESFGSAVLEIIADTPTIIPAEEGE